MQDDFTHRTPHFGYTSEIREQSGGFPAAKSKDKSADSLQKLDGRNSRQLESHGRGSRERDNISSRNRQEEVRR